MPKTIMELQNGSECRWFVAEHPEKLYCAAPVFGTTSYCREHARVVYVPSQRPRPRLPFRLPVEPTSPPTTDEAVVKDIAELFSDG